MFRFTPVKEALIHDRGPNIKTFVLTKINTTGTSSPKIMEVAMIALHSKDMQAQAGGDAPDCMVPREVDKLVIFCDPGHRVHAHTEAESKVNRGEIQQSRKKTFDRHTVNLIHGFLSRQEKPICLFAHHGYQMQFPMLKRELANLTMALDSIDGEPVLCSDFIWVYRDMDVPTSVGTDYGVSCMDVYVYTLDSLYRRFVKDSLRLDDFTAEKQALCLMKVMRNTPLVRFERAFTCCQLSAVSAQTGQEVDEEQSSVHCRSLFPSHNLDTQTFVFFDLETSGLNTPESTAAMTELCMVAVDSRYVDVAESEDADDTPAIPRVNDKIKIMVDPIRQIEPGAERISGISNGNLEARKKQPFSHKTEKLLSDFLERQCQPVTIVAYNGDNFDFKILHDHLKRCGARSSIWSSIYCADALVGLRELTANIGIPSYQLSAVFRHFFRREPSDCHSAEGDVQAMFAVVKAAPNNLPYWLDQHKKKFA